MIVWFPGLHTRGYYDRSVACTTETWTLEERGREENTHTPVNMKVMTEPSVAFKLLGEKMNSGFPLEPPTLTDI